LGRGNQCSYNFRVRAPGNKCPLLEPRVVILHIQGVLPTDERWVHH
jgi:hypothetical protein